MKFKNPFKSIKSNERLLSIRAEYGYLSNSFWIPAFIMLGIYLAIGHKPLGDSSILTLDLNAQYVYFYEALREFVWGDASLLYSFSRSLGGEFMGIYAYYVASPISYIVALFPKSMMLYALLTVTVVKVGLCGLSFGFYLHKNTRTINRDSIIMFSTMYALSAYSITYQNNIMWLDGLFLLPILTYSIERLIKTGRFKLYAFTLALMMASHYYIGYMLCWYTAFCFFFSYFKDSDRALINPTGEKNHFARSLARIGGSTLLGIGMSAFIIGAAYYSLQFGKSDFSEPIWDIVARFDLFDLFPKLLPGSYDTVMHEGLPLLYSGILTLFMLPVFIMAKRVTGREKIFYVSFSLLYVLIMVVNPLDLVMHGFQEPNCLNYRYSFILIFLLLVMAYKGFSELHEHSPKTIFATGSVILALLFIAQKMEFPNFMLDDKEGFEFGFELHKLPFFWVVLFTIIAVLAIGAILCYLIRSTNKERMGFILLCAVCIELFANGLVLICSLSFDVGRSSYSSYSVYFRDLQPIVEQVQAADKGFYRSEKTSHRCTNDNMALNIKGLSNSTSTLNAKVISLLEYLGYYSDAHWTQYIGSTMITDALFGIKYVYSNTQNEYNKETLTQNELMDMYYELFAEDEHYYAYKNPYALGMAYGVSDKIKELETDLEFDYKSKEGLKNPFETQTLLLNTLLGLEGEDMLEFYSPIVLKKTTNIQGAGGSVGGNMEYAATSGDIEESFVTFTFKVERDGPLYLCLPTGYERSFTLYVNDEHYVQNSIYSRIINLGYRKAGEDMELKFRRDDGQLYFYKDTNYLYTLDVDAFEHAIEQLKSTNLIIDEDGWSDDHFTGSITTHEDGKTIMTTIPYDEGWKVYVDGEQVKTYAVYGDSLMAFDIEDSGEHRVEFKYSPDIYLIGGIVSAVSCAVFVLLCTIDIIKRKKASVPVSSEAATSAADGKDLTEPIEATKTAEAAEATKSQGED